MSATPGAGKFPNFCSGHNPQATSDTMIMLDVYAMVERLLRNPG
jgi:hypothetical protein